MTAESIVYEALQNLAGGNVFPDVAPSDSTAPWITYQAVGGKDFTNLDNSLSNPRNTRMQVAVWHTSRLAAAELMEQVYEALNNPTVKGYPIGAPVSVFEQDTRLYGSRLDFSIFWL